jgi:SAM-dependent methyltransferase
LVQAKPTTRLPPPTAVRRVLLTAASLLNRPRMQCAPSAERNKEPIAEVLAKYEPFAGSMPATVLEIASGTGQHAAHLAARFSHCVWQPTEFAGGSAGPEAPAYGDLSPVFASIVAHCGGMKNVRPPLALDASSAEWPEPIASATFDAIFACNVLHISPFAVTEGLLAGASRLLAAGGLLAVYGPFMVDGAHTSDSNAAFSERLKSQNAAWAVRDSTAIAELARTQHGLELVAREAMPANNFVLIFRKP